MRKFICTCLSMALAVSLIPLYANATGGESHGTIEYYSDGSYCIIEIEEEYSRASGTKTGTKNYSYYSSDNELLWIVSLTGTYSYTGVASTCTAANVNVTIYNSAWYLYAKASNMSGSTAYGEATVARKMLGVTVEKKVVNLTLTCDANGNLS